MTHVSHLHYNRLDTPGGSETRDARTLPSRVKRRRHRINTMTAAPRLLSREQAAIYCGVAPETFDSYRRRGILPDPVAGTKRWDRKLIDEFLDRQSGITEGAALSPLDAWRASRHDQG